MVTRQSLPSSGSPAAIQPARYAGPRRALLADAAAVLREEAAALGALLVPAAAQALAEVVDRVRVYSSGRIEGHDTTIAEIEAVARGEFAADPVRRDKQQEALAGLETMSLLRAEVPRDTGPDSAELLAWLYASDRPAAIHREYTARIPAPLRTYTTRDGAAHALVPGELRHLVVSVGQHVAPPPDAVPEQLRCWAQAYRMATDRPGRVLDALASHHRLLFIHPFLDGNGRVARLHTELTLESIGVRGGGLWSASAAMLKDRDGYMQALAAASRTRAGDLDGRGNLSQQGLEAWLRWALDRCTAEVRAMQHVARACPDNIERWARDQGADARTVAVIGAVWRSGELSRAEALGTTGASGRTASRLVGEATRLGVVTADTHRAPLRPAIPREAVASLGQLYPRG
ncbi:MAG: Fic family protein [Polyangiales bacterium]